MKYFFPQTDKKYIEPNRGNVFGNLWSTFNNDYQSNPGALRITPRLRVNVSTADLASLGLPIGFRYFDARNWTVAGTKVFKNTGNTNTAFVQDASTNTPTTSAAVSDIELFNSRLWVTTAGKLYSKASDGSGTGDWTDRGSMVSNQTHPMTYFLNFDRLYIGNGNIIYSIDTSDLLATSGDYTVTLDSSRYSITSLCSTNNSIFIGTINTLNAIGNGAILEWDGISAKPTAEYPLQARGCAAMTILNNVVYAVDTNGLLLRFTGYSFEEIGRFPFNDKLPLFSGTNGKFIHPNGMIPTKNGTLLCLVNNLVNDSAGSVNENMASGIWEWGEEEGLKHKYSFTYTPMASATVTDFGQNRVALTGGLASAVNDSSSSVGTLFVGATYYTNASSTTSGIFIDDTLDTIQKKGYGVTTWIESPEIESKWERFWIVYRRLLASTDSITPKYRLSEEAPVEGDITWVNTTSFTVANSAVVVSNYWTSGTGGEVEILRGTGGGSCAHITNAVLVGGTWTVTIDETITGVTTGTATARFQKWIKLLPAQSLNQIKSYSQFAINNPDTRIQIKVCFTYTGQGEFYKSAIFSNEDIKITA